MTIALFIWAAIQSFLFGFNILLFKRSKANLFLGAFFIFTSLNIFFQYLSRFTNWKFEVPEILYISDIIGFLYGPIIYLYARQLIFKKFKLAQYIHFLPALLFAVFFSVREFIIYAPFEFFDYINTTFQRVVLFLIFLSNLIYLIYLIHLSGRYNYGKSGKGFWVIGWLSIFYMFFTLKVIIGLIFFVYQAFVQPIYGEEIATAFRIFSEYVFIFFNAIIIIITGYWSIKDPFEVYNLSDKQIQEIDDKTESVEAINRVQIPVEVTENAEPKFRIPESEVADKVLLLNSLIEKKVHLNPDLNERELARLMGVPLHYLSNLLNEHVKESFTEFVNRNRIEDAKLKLLDDSLSNLTIFAIALDCGYNSESTFYTNFKKFTGVTPKSYKNKHI